MDIQLGTDIIGSDGEKLGVVDSLVVEPRTGEIQAIIVRQGFFFPTDKIIPIDRVSAAESDKVHMNLSKREIEDLTEYMDAEYIWPPAGYYANTGYLWPATPVYSSELLVDEEVHQRSPDAIIISEGTLVVDKNEHDVGRVHDIIADEQGRVSGFKVEEGFFSHHEHYIPAHVIASADDTIIQLSVDKDELDRLARDRQVRPPA